ITRKLTNVAGTRLGQSVSKYSKIIHVNIPIVIDNKAPELLALFQYNPITNGTNNETKLRIDDSLTNSKILDRRQAITVATTLKTRIDNFVVINNCASFSLFLNKGLIRFSETIEAGASMAELVILIIAESKDPKNKI